MLETIEALLSIFMETSHKSIKFWTSGDSIRDLLIPQLRSPTALYVVQGHKELPGLQVFFSEHFRNYLPSHW